MGLSQMVLRPSQLLLGIPGHTPCKANGMCVIRIFGVIFLGITVVGISKKTTEVVISWNFGSKEILVASLEGQHWFLL